MAASKRRLSRKPSWLKTLAKTEIEENENNKLVKEMKRRKMSRNHQSEISWHERNEIEIAAMK
jgi:UTP:GlnB (protein PII) uridylyltransferase